MNASKIITKKHIQQPKTIICNMTIVVGNFVVILSFYCSLSFINTCFFLGSSSDSSPKSSQSPGAQSPHLAGQSPKKKKQQHKLNLELGARAWNAMGEKIDPNLPLEQQG